WLFGRGDDWRVDYQAAAARSPGGRSPDSSPAATGRTGGAFRNPPPAQGWEGNRCFAHHFADPELRGRDRGRIKNRPRHHRPKGSIAQIGRDARAVAARRPAKSGLPDNTLTRVTYAAECHPRVGANPKGWRHNRRYPAG